MFVSWSEKPGILTCTCRVHHTHSDLLEIHVNNYRFAFQVHCTTSMIGCSHTRTHTCTHARTHTHAHTHARTHAHTHTHTHTDYTRRGGGSKDRSTLVVGMFHHKKASAVNTALSGVCNGVGELQIAGPETVSKLCVLSPKIREGKLEL